MPNFDELNQALRRADLWRVLALSFSTPTERSLADLQGLCNDLASAPIMKSLPFQPGLADLARYIESQDLGTLEHEHNALFSMDVMVPAYEGSYQRIERGAVVGDVAGYYQAFGLGTLEKSGPPDSLWNELAFLSWLSLKEAYAIQHEMEDALAITRNATHNFLQDHLGRWAGSFSTRLLRTTENPLYVTAVHLLLATVSLVADELQVEEIHPLDMCEQPAESDAVACPVAGSPTTSRVQDKGSLCWTKGDLGDRFLRVP